MCKIKLHNFLQYMKNAFVWEKGKYFIENNVNMVRRQTHILRINSNYLKLSTFVKNLNSNLNTKLLIGIINENV